MAVVSISVDILQGVSLLNPTHRCCDCMECMRKGYGISVNDVIKYTDHITDRRGLDAFLDD